MRTHEAASAALTGTPWDVMPFRRVTRLVREPNVDGVAQALSLSSKGFMYERAAEGAGSQASSEDTVLRNWLVQPGDIVVNPMWLVGGGVALSRLAGSVSPDYRVYRTDDRVDPRFLAYLLRTPHYIEQYGLYTRGDTTFDRRVSRHDFEDLPVAVPDLVSQRRIAEYLDAETARIDRLIAVNSRASTLAWEHFRRIRRDVVCQGRALGSAETSNELSSRSGWRVAPLWMVARNYDSIRIPLNAEQRGARPGPYPYWGANSIQDTIDDYLYEGEHVLIAEDGGPFFVEDRDAAWVVDGRFWVNNHAHVLRGVDVPNAWLSACLNCVDYSLFVGGSTRDKLTQADLNAIPIPVAPEDHVRDSLKTIQEASDHARSLERVASTNRDLLTERKQALITAAVTGHITV